jgi:diguanylate cyclase (GGDEF)-like protein
MLESRREARNVPESPAEESTRQGAFHDELTGLPNRRLFQDRLTIGVEGARRRHGRLAVLLLDLDRFKFFNDSLGHDAGDRILQEIARRLRAVVRASDTIARIGGDEFLVLLADAGPEEGTALVAAKLLDVIANPVVIGEDELSITASIGIAVFPEDGDDAGILVRSAESAMYRAKDAGRNTYRVSHSAPGPGPPIAVAAALRHALERREFQLQYQPIVTCGGTDVVGAEALLRWNHPEFANLGPSRFIAIAEEHGLIGPIGEWVLTEACRRARKWNPPGRTAVRVAVNISVRQFQQSPLVAVVERALASSGLSPEFLNLEITESVAIRNADRAVSVLRSLRDLGIRISIDDFGTGYSSLTYLRILPIDFLKIDASFVGGIQAGNSHAAIVKGVIDLAHNLGIRVTAEGVETPRQLDLLRSFECDEFQGFFFSKPVADGQLAGIFRASRGAPTPARRPAGARNHRSRVSA